MKKEAIVVFSGGQDSTTCLYQYLNNGWDCHLFTINYNQLHQQEIRAAHTIARMTAEADLTGKVLSHEVLVLGPVLGGTSPLVNEAEKLEQYDGPLPDGIEKTFVPMRNQLFLTLAANRAAIRGCNVVVTGVCEEDYGGYPDCRRVFIDALEQATRLASFTGEGSLPDQFEIHTPLMSMTKAETCKLGYALNGCREALAYSHTSYDGQYPPTGKDHATLLRAAGFEVAGLPDPLVIRAVNEGLMELPETPNYDDYR